MRTIRTFLMTINPPKDTNVIWLKPIHNGLFTMNIHGNNGWTDIAESFEAGGGGGNVLADWNAISGPASILNKPDLNVKLENITGLILSGTNITVTGNGTHLSPYTINSNAGGGVSFVIEAGSGISVDTSNPNIVRIINDSPNVQSDWNANSGLGLILNKPASIVTSIEGRSGVVTLDKSDVGLSNVDNTSDVNKPISTAVNTALNNKVDKEAGKGLSTNDYTNLDKSKIQTIDLSGLGNMFLANDGTYKSVGEGGVEPGTDAEDALNWDGVPTTENAEWALTWN